MAKISLTKLGLKKNQDIKTIIWNDQNIEIKLYLPIQQKLQMMSEIINLSHDTENNYANPVKIKIYTSLKIIENYTNISLTEKQQEDPCKLYDLFTSTGLLMEIKNTIPTEELEEIDEGICQAIKSFYDYRNSVVGIIDTLSTNYDETTLDLKEIEKMLGNKDFEWLKEITKYL